MVAQTAAKQKSLFPNFVEIVRNRAEKLPDQLAFIYLNFKGDEEPLENKISYRELDEKARTIAGWLQSRNAFGERAMLLYPPGLDYIAAYLGCLYAGVTAVPAYPPTASSHMHRLDLIASDSQSKFAMSIGPIISLLLPKLKEESILHTLDWVATDELQYNTDCFKHQLAIDRNTTAFLQYTSGSTSEPKGVVVTHGNLLENLFLIDTYFGHHKNSQGVIWLPPYHDMGLIGGILQPIYAGFPCTLMSPVDFIQKPLRWLRAISDYGGTTSGGINFAFELCLKKINEDQVKTLNLESWDLAFIGADFIQPDTLKRFADKFATCGFKYKAFYPCYGLAESTLFVSGSQKYEAPIYGQFDQNELMQRKVRTTLPDEQHSQRMVSCGRPLIDVRILIVDPDSNDLCQPNQCGEIWTASESVAKGYWNWSEEKSNQVCKAFTSCGEGPFLRTGDLGFFHENELFITGRIKNLIIINGKNYYSQDIERSVENSHEALRVGFGAAFSINRNNEEHLVVVQEVNRQSLRKLNGKEVARAIYKSVLKEHFIELHEIVLIKTSSIPKTSSGKIQNYRCRELHATGELKVVYSENPGNDTDLFGSSTSHTPLFVDNASTSSKDRKTKVGTEKNISNSEKILEKELLEQLQDDCLITVGSILKLKSDEIDIDSELTEIGLGSIAIIDLANQINLTFEIEIAPDLFYKFPSVQLFTEYLIENFKENISNYYLGKSWADPDSATIKIAAHPHLELVDGANNENSPGMVEALSIIDVEKQEPTSSLTDSYISYQKKKKRSLKSKNSLTKKYLQSLLQENDNQVRLIVTTAANFKTEVVMAGKGKTILLIPGFCMTAPVWFHQLQEWSSTHQVIVVHLPEHGFSQRLADFSLEAMSDNIVEVLKHLDVADSFHIVGNSLGGLVAQTLAVRHPDRIDSLTLSGCGYEVKSKDNNPDLIEESLANFTRSCWNDIENVVSCTDSKAIVENRDRYLKLLSTAQYIHHEAARRYMIQFQHFSTRPILSRIKCSTLIISGKQDEFKKYQYNPREVQTLYTEIPNCRYLEFLDSGHFPFMTHYREFNEKVKSFISEQEVILSTPN